jgi:hypothetical protein
MHRIAVRATRRRTIHQSRYTPLRLLLAVVTNGLKLAADFYSDSAFDSKLSYPLSTLDFEKAPKNDPYFHDPNETTHELNLGQSTATLNGPFGHVNSFHNLDFFSDIFSDSAFGPLDYGEVHKSDPDFSDPNWVDRQLHRGQSAATLNRPTGSSNSLGPLNLEKAPKSDPYFPDPNDAAYQLNPGQSTATLDRPIGSLKSIEILDHLIAPLPSANFLHDASTTYSQDEDIVKHVGTSFSSTTSDPQDKPRTQAQFSGTTADECDTNDNGGSTVANSVWSTYEDIVIDENGPLASGLVVASHSENAGDSPPVARTLAVMFNEAQSGLERLFVDLQSFEDDVRDDLSVTGSDCSEVFEAEDSCDGQGKEAGDRQTPGGMSRATGIGDRASYGSGRKRQRSETYNDDDSRTIVDTTQQEPTSGSEQMRLKCCHKNCSGTDDQICGVIRSLSSHKEHKIHICKTCFVRLPDDSPDNVHQSLDCVKHCLSTTCKGNPTPDIDHRHRFVPGVCLSKSMKRGDIEDNYRYIFRLVHPNPETHPQPDNVFTTGEKKHTGVKSRRRTRGLNNQELLTRSNALTAQANASAALVEELRKEVAANTTRMEVITRGLLAERTTTTHLWKMIKRLQIIADEALQPETIGNQKSLDFLRQRAEMERSDALDFARALSQALPTPPVSLRASQRSSALSTPNGNGTAGQYQPSRNVSQQHHNNYAASGAHNTSDQGSRAAESHPDEQALLRTQNNSSTSLDNLRNSHGTTPNFELATDWSAGTDDAVPRSDSNQHYLLPSTANQLAPHRSNEHYATPHQSTPNYLDPNLPNLHQPNSHRPHLHQFYTHQFNPHQPIVHQPNPHQSYQHQPNHHQSNPNPYNPSQSAGETEGDGFESTMGGPQEFFPSATFADWLPESTPDVGSSNYQSDMGYDNTQWYLPPSGQS